MIQFETSADSAFSPITEREILSSDQINSVLSQLTSTIELSTLGSLYFTQLAAFLPVESLDLSEFGDAMRFGLRPRENLETISLPVSTIKFGESKSTAYIRYQFSEMIAPAQRRILANLHHIFIRPLGHALEFRRLKLMATKDPLTNLGNRNGFNEAAQRLINRHIRTNQIFGLLVVDLDNFKQVNDCYGHQQGDRVLQETAHILIDSIRGHEEAFRFGGDEFCCLLDVSCSQELNTVAQRIQRAMHSHPLLTSHGVTSSIGGSLFKAGDSLEMLFERADRALYEAKDGGKDTYQAA
ncbi:GGDEF domain-containing protein [Alteromonas sp. AMM-1]|uniref:GGDEF domain-containing protein n=1 Tax=Alteromonas sp. AMM-1 TaxID=3394233 RepID=UPI0039A43898